MYHFLPVEVTLSKKPCSSWRPGAYWVDMNDEQLKKLTEYLDKRFDNQDAKFEKRIEDLSDQFADQFGKLYQHVEKRFNDAGERIDRLENRLSNLEGGIDQVLKNQETDQQERLAVNHQLDRHERWITKAADHIDVSYNPAA
jgi:predicted  nucleic acid-binding Zn-ribbon protein